MNFSTWIETMMQPMNDAEIPNRRNFLARSAMGIGSVALASLLRDEKLLAVPHVPRQLRTFDLKPKPAASEPRAGP